MDEQEVERIARLMHETHRAYLFAAGRKKGDSDPGHYPYACDPWEQQSETYRARVRHVARAVLADQFAPTAIVTG